MLFHLEDSEIGGNWSRPMGPCNRDESINETIGLNLSVCLFDFRFDIKMITRRFFQQNHEIIRIIFGLSRLPAVKWRVSRARTRIQTPNFSQQICLQVNTFVIKGQVIKCRLNRGVSIWKQSTRQCSDGEKKSARRARCDVTRADVCWLCNEGQTKVKGQNSLLLTFSRGFLVQRSRLLPEQIK